MNTYGNFDLFGNPVEEKTEKTKKSNGSKRKASTSSEDLPEKLGKAIRLPVPDFNDPERKPTCLEVDFPIAQINALSNLEGNAGKPIYQMSKWWARRRSSVFRSMLIAAATEAPEDKSEAAKLVWDHYYCNHQKAGSFKNLKVLDCFMGGGTTLVEGSRLGMQMTGVDLNPVAWFVVKNELACSDPEQVKALFDHIEAEVKPQIQPFYTTTCPRGHKGKWISVETGEEVTIDPIDLEPEERKKYHWEGPEVIYTFWAKHGPCQAKGCNHRTPIFNSPLIAQKKLSTNYIDMSCPKCGKQFHAELGETRMAPGSERIVLEDEHPFTEMSQYFAQLLNDYDKGNGDDTIQRLVKLLELVNNEKGLYCPDCESFAGQHIVNILEKHNKPSTKASERKKKSFKIKKKAVQMWLLIHPDWMNGATGYDNSKELGGYPGATPELTSLWNLNRLENLSFVEIRGIEIPKTIISPNGNEYVTNFSTIPKQAHFTCGNCGKTQKRISSTKMTSHSAPMAVYSLQCYCPDCDKEGYNYNGRYFQVPTKVYVAKVNASEFEWNNRKDNDLKELWPISKIEYSMRTHVKDPLPDHGYTHWWMLFNSRQLLIHSVIIKSIISNKSDSFSLDIKEQALGVFQQYLRNQNLFLIWNIQRDTPEPMFSNANYNPKFQIIENNVFHNFGRGNWTSSSLKCLEGINWVHEPWEAVVCEKKSERVFLNDPVIQGTEIYCTSSTNIDFCKNNSIDLVVTDPPFGDNLYYADLADFFYVWLRIVLKNLYKGLPEFHYFNAKRTPHSLEAIDNSVEHPDDREEYEKHPFITKKIIKDVINISGSNILVEKDPNPLFRPNPSSDFYSQTLSACWAEAGRLLKPSGIMAFTFHHSEDQAWIDILKALFDAGYYLISTYPIRSDETKGESAQFGSQKIEYDIIHVCRKRLKDPEPVSWARMRRWVKEESQRLKDLLENTHAKELPESDLRVILRGKSLEFYSRHYGQVFTGDGQVLDVRDALLGINQLLDDLLEDTSQTGGFRPPDIAEPASRLYLRLFHTRTDMPRDELHKTLRGTGISQGDLEARGWIRMVGKVANVIPIPERFEFFTAKGRNRKVIKTDLDQTHFLIGAALPDSGLKIETELNNPNFQIKKAVDEILKWYGSTSKDEMTKLAAITASQIVEHWRNRRKEEKPESQQLSFFEMLEEQA